MEISFLGQGLNPARNRQAGETIKTALTGGEYTSLRIFVAFLSKSGLNAILTELNTFQRTAGNSVKIFVGVDLHGTSKEALELLLANNIETYIVYSPTSLIYHPKIYLFEGTANSMAIVGSSNLTTTGLFQNVEASVCVKFPIGDVSGQAFLNDLLQHYNEVINATHSSCKRLTNTILTLLVDSKIVLPESTIRIKRNKSEGEFSKRDLSTQTELLAAFGKIVPIRPPRGFSKKVSAEIYDVNLAGDQVKVSYEETTLEAGTMWYEARAVTGGSGNILDLSKTGRTSARSVVDGSAKFFEFDIEDETLEVQIAIIHAGKEYKNNIIKFHQDGVRPNGSWRLQLNGETTAGESLTSIVRKRNRKPGPLVGKIVTFKKVNNRLYEMNILPGETLDQLKEKSSFWATNGSSRASRMYGFIA